MTFGNGFIHNQKNINYNKGLENEWTKKYFY
jgi:hypothetical protein